MAALSADKIRDRRGTNLTRVEAFSVKTSATLYIGSMCALTTLNRVQAAAAATGLRPAGVCVGVVNESGTQITAITGNAGGTVKALIEWGSEFLVDVSAAAQTYINVGKTVYIATDNEVTDTTAAGTAAVRVAIGVLTQFETGKTVAWVQMRNYGDTGAV